MRTFRTNIMAIAFCLYLVTVASLCFLHGDDIPRVTGTWFGMPADKVAHFLMFLPFLPLSFLAIRNKNRQFLASMLILSVLAVIGCGTAYLTEIIQDKLTYRSYDIKDFMSDCGGLAAGYILITLWLTIKHSIKRR